MSKTRKSTKVGETEDGAKFNRLERHRIRNLLHEIMEEYDAEFGRDCRSESTVGRAGEERPNQEFGPTRTDKEVEVSGEDKGAQIGTDEFGRWNFFNDW
jgi:hypothetical protein